MERNNLINKGVAVIIILLFIGVSVVPSTGNNVVEKSSSSDAPNNGVDLAIVEIVPYYFSFNPYIFQDLYFTAKVENIGDVPSSENLWLWGIGSYLITGRIYEEVGVGVMGGLQIGDSWCPQYGDGILFSLPFGFPRFYRIEYTLSPTDSNPDNNHLEQVFLIWGFLGAHYKHIPFI